MELSEKQVKSKCLSPATWQRGNKSVSYVLPFITFEGVLKTIVVEWGYFIWRGQSKFPLVSATNPYREHCYNRQKVGGPPGDKAGNDLIFKLLLQANPCVLLFPI